ncbi:MAG: flavin reductase [Lachnospiraceae bacterium]|nr:flavin reductase [Lachnospiraceae bacterium]
MNQKAMYNMSYGLFVVTSNLNGKDNGCITNTAIQVTTEPAKITVTIDKRNYTHDMVMESKILTVSILSEAANFDLIKHFGFQSGRDVDKFADYQKCKKASNNTMIITEGTNAYISGNVVETVDLGSHTMFVVEVTDMDVLSDSPSATYSYYHEHIKPKPEAVGQTSDGQTIWRCTVCGYEYVGEELPDDFICPVCKKPASYFEKVN